jgi:biotin transport system substrate-specific component
MLNTTTYADLLLQKFSRAVERAGVNVGLVLGGTLYVALLSQLAFPLPNTPVMVSMGTFAVLSAGAALGAPRALASLSLYLVLGGLGVPVFQGAKSGLAVPTLGFLVGYILAATLLGKLAEKGWDKSFGKMFGMMLLGNLTIYALGVPYLMFATGTTSLAKGLMMGCVPFLVGDIIKCVLATAIFPAGWKLVQRMKK